MKETISRRGNDGSDQKSLMHINTTTGWKNNFHKTDLLVLESRGERIDWITKHLTGVKTILSVRTQGTTYLCLKR